MIGHLVVNIATVVNLISLYVLRTYAPRVMISPGSIVTIWITGFQLFDRDIGFRRFFYRHSKIDFEIRLGSRRYADEWRMYRPVSEQR